jgi:hypothetical protein
MQKFFGILLVTLSTALVAQPATPGLIGGQDPCESVDGVCPPCSTLHGKSCSKAGAGKTCTLPGGTQHKCYCEGDPLAWNCEP